MLRLTLVRRLPFLARWIEVAPAACCGLCPTCIGTAVTGLALPMVVKEEAVEPVEATDVGEVGNIWATRHPETAASGEPRVFGKTAG